MRLLSLLITIPLSLSAGFFNWFYIDPATVKEFECPYQCGKPGTEGMRQVQWKGMQVLWELDCLGHAIRGKDFPYSAPPATPEDPWFQKTTQDGVMIAVSLEIPKLRDIPFSKYQYFDPSSIGMFAKEESIWWPMVKRDDEGNIIGFWVAYYSKDFEQSIEGILDEDDWPLDSLKEIYHFAEAIDSILTDDLGEWFEWEFPRLHKVAELVIDNQENLEKFYIKKINATENLLSQGKRFYMGSDLEESKKALLEEAKTSQECAAFAKKTKEKLEKTRDDIAAGLRVYAPRIRSRLHEVAQSYCAIFDDCIAHHNTPAAYYQRALFHFGEGNNMNCIEDIKKLFEMTPPDMLTDKMREKLLLRQGKAECELDLFEDAIFTLSKYISAFPRKKEAYLQRAIAHFEMGNTAEALRDFTKSSLKMYPAARLPAESLECGLGVMKGLVVGGFKACEENISFAISSLSGLSHGIIALATSPEETSEEFVHACQQVIALIKEEGLPEIILSAFPEVKEFFTNDNPHPLREGELMGELIGRFGIDVLLLKGGGKAVKAVRNFRKANAILTLERMAQSIQIEQQMIHHTREWWNRTSKVIDQLRVGSSKDFDKDLYRIFRKVPLSETQVRKILHRAGYKTFPRPKGVPQSYRVSISKTNGGMVYRHGTNPHIKVRVSPGIPDSINPAQRNPYVVHKTQKGFLDKNGNICKKTEPQTHIPIEEYDFNKLLKMVPVDD